jgi:3-oxoacyl-(acyl-carrier-protein) synthase
MTAPPETGEGAACAMQIARSRKTRPDQVDYVNAHAT